MNVLLFGQEVPPPDPIELRAGPLTMLFEPDTVFLRYIKFGRREVLRGIYAAVRDQQWGTVTPRISDLQIEQGAESFELSFDVHCAQHPIDFAWHGEITGTADGTVVLTFDGRARSTFLRNRIGFCVLHPIDECAGHACLVEQTNGEQIHGTFPQDISPHQPFMNIKAISHAIAPGLTARVSFTGDTFEMEDQRNWIDASFKTYCTPLGLPFPVEIKAGTRVRQSVTLTLEGEASGALSAVPRAPGRIFPTSRPAVSVRLPDIGLGMMQAQRTLSNRARRRLSETLRPDHLRVELHLSRPAWRDLLERAHRNAEALETSLELVVYVTDNVQAETEALAVKLTRMRPKLTRCLVLPEANPNKIVVTPHQHFDIVRKGLQSFDPQLSLGLGTDLFFTELNRNRPGLNDVDFVSYSINPQVHAFDNASIVESLSGQTHTVSTAKSFCKDVPIVVTPVTWKIRRAPEAAEPGAPPSLPNTADTRQMSLFGAGFTLGTIKSLGQAGVRSMTLYETAGLHGILETNPASPFTEAFPAPADCVYPTYHVLADLREFAGGSIIPVRESQPLSFVGLLLEKDTRYRLCLANLTGQDVEIVYDPIASPARLKVLDQTNIRQAMMAPEAFRAEPGQRVASTGETMRIALKPYAYVRVDM